MSLSLWFSDEDIVSQIRCFFDLEEQDSIDLNVLSQATLINDDLMEVKVKDRVFRFSLKEGGVYEVE